MLGRALDTCIYMEKEKTRSLTTTVFPLVIKYTVVARWRSHADRVAGLGVLTVQLLPERILSLSTTSASGSIIS